MNTKKLLKSLRQRRSDIMMVLSEDDSIYNPQVLVGLIYEMRSLTKMINIIIGEDMKGGEEE